MLLAYYDGTFVEKASITISPNDFGFSRGITVFELVRIYGGVPFRLSDHLDRLEHGAKMFDIKNIASAADITAAVQHICAKNGYSDSIIRFYLTAGECGQASASFALCDAFTPHFLILEDQVKPAHPEAPYGLELCKKGLRLKIVPYERELPTVKSTNYSLGYHAARITAGKGWDDILFMRHDGIVTETTRNNFFCIIDDVLCTPKNGILFGITRKVLLELAVLNNIQFKECDLTAADIGQAKEAFITSSFLEMVPVSQIDNHKLLTTIDGPVYKKMRRILTDYITETVRRMA